MKINERLIWKAVIVALFLIVFLFTWHEWGSFSFYEKINHDKVAAFATSVAAILTAATVFLLYKQIQEQIRQRKSDFEPFLVFDDLKANITNGKWNIKVVNIGRGPARNIQVKWVYNYKECLNEYNQQIREKASNDHIPRKVSHILPSNTVAIEKPKSFFNIVQVLDDISAMVKKYPVSIVVSYVDIYGKVKVENWSMDVSKSDKVIVRVKFVHSDNKEYI